MSTFLTEFFTVLLGGMLFWLVQELRDRTKARRILRELADERAAEEGLHRIRETYIHAELAKGNNIPRQPE